MQTRKASAVEALTNCAIGWSINFVANILVLPLLYRPDHNIRSAFLIGVVFTGISLARSYVLRRWFNGLRFGQVKA